MNAQRRSRAYKIATRRSVRYLLRAGTAGIKTENDFRACRSHFGIRIICLRNCRQHLHIFLRSSKRVASRGILRKRIKDYRTKNVKLCLIQRECAGEKTGKSGKCAKQVNKIAQKIKKSIYCGLYYVNTLYKYKQSRY